jgi:outer membrane protein assembly factor BamB
MPLNGADAWTAPAVSDGVVYAGATDGQLYAFKA